MSRRYWLVKSEPDVYSIDHLAEEGTAEWDGVRNYQARNFMRDDMKVGDQVLYYHSNTKPPGIVGLARVCRESYPDHTSWDPDSGYFDTKSTPESPRWFMVDLEFVEKFAEPITLAELKADPALEGMLVTKKGQRLSVQPVDKEHFEHIVAIAERG